MEIETTTGRPRWWYWRMMITVVLSSATAYFLSIFGYIPVNPFYATVMGSFIGVLYVLFENYSGRHMANRWVEHNKPKEGAELK
jgi:hypothetical protein